MNPLDEPMDDAYVYVSPWPTILKYGLIGGSVIIAINICTFVFGFSAISAGSSILSLFLIGCTFIVYLLLMIFSIKEYRDSHAQGYISLGNGLLTSYGSAMITGILGALFVLLYLLVIDPEYMRRAMEATYDEMGIDSSTLSLTDNYDTITILVSQGSSFILGSIVGVVMAIIISAIMKRDRPFYSQRQY